MSPINFLLSFLLDDDDLSTLFSLYLLFGRTNLESGSYYVSISTKLQQSAQKFHFLAWTHYSTKLDNRQQQKKPDRFQNLLLLFPHLPKAASAAEQKDGSAENPNSWRRILLFRVAPQSRHFLPISSAPAFTHSFAREKERGGILSGGLNRDRPQ